MVMSIRTCRPVSRPKEVGRPIDENCRRPSKGFLNAAGVLPALHNSGSRVEIEGAAPRLGRRMPARLRVLLVGLTVPLALFLAVPILSQAGLDDRGRSLERQIARKQRII